MSLFILPLIFIGIIYVLWINTVVYTTKKDRWGVWRFDSSSERPFIFTWLNLIELIPLLLPVINIIWFSVLICSYTHYSFNSGYCLKETSILWKPKGITDFFISIYDSLNRKI